MAHRVIRMIGGLWDGEALEFPDPPHETVALHRGPGESRPGDFYRLERVEEGGVPETIYRAYRA